MRAREKLYNAGVFLQHSLPVPVISVGNLMLGGTGKTPTVQHIARLLLKEGYQPAILSRGYGGHAREAVNIVSDGKTTLLSPYLAGDEPFMLAESLSGVPVLTGSRRIHSCRHAVDQFNSDVLILDDGFQHLAVRRDIDVVLFDSTDLAGNSRVFPGGPLREPVSALNRCHFFLLTGKTPENESRTKRFAELLTNRFPDKPVFASSLATSELLRLDGTNERDHSSKRYFAFCGIANPARFENSLTELGIQLAGFQPLKDHTSYTQTLVSNLCKKAIECGAERMVTTEKDLVKLRSFEMHLPLYVLRIQHKIEQDLDLFLVNLLKDRERRNADRRREVQRSGVSKNA